ncbi:MAG: tRNA (guanosine(37)-N1)-methyltransferase TrmD [Polyangiales bacterium]
MRFQVITIFPELIEAFAKFGLIARAVEHGSVRIDALSPRRFSSDKHLTVDDAPFGGGSGMVMLPEPLAQAMQAFDEASAEARATPCHRVLLTPLGKPFEQADARRLSALPGLMLVCGRYEGVDERVESLVHETISLGDFVLNGGEVAAMAVIESVARLLPGVLGNAESLAEESHAAGLLEYPQYTRPRTFRGQDVPAVLLSGNHAAIARWRRKQALLRTRALRPDLFSRLTLSDEDRALLAEPE